MRWIKKELYIKDFSCLINKFLILIDHVGHFTKISSKLSSTVCHKKSYSCCIDGLATTVTFFWDILYYIEVKIPLNKMITLLSADNETHDQWPGVTRPRVTRPWQVVTPWQRCHPLSVSALSQHSYFCPAAWHFSLSRVCCCCCCCCWGHSMARNIVFQLQPKIWK